MSSSSPLSFAIRGTQTLFAVVVLGLSSSLIKGHVLGNVPATLGFAAFAGSVSLVGALLGFAAPWVQLLQGQFGVLIDAVLVGINLAGGLLMAVKLNGVHCTKVDDENYYKHEKDIGKMISNDVICGGIGWMKGKNICYYAYRNSNTLANLLTRCKMSQADTAFMFLTGIVVAVAAVLGYLRLKRGH
ncbi:hypothetical protein OPT61_g6654 [Boeremia exigua]|uniref:Uncharacterized protein n=1 Tax=Boeremia exigua TaxID=749465 RepID=A0ACC2I5A7_9PLEO|nr:hypothetical protein OPT61_g6654 [Boeremia exigua]